MKMSTITHVKNLAIPPSFGPTDRMYEMARLDGNIWPPRDTVQTTVMANQSVSQLGCLYAVRSIILLLPPPSPSQYSRTPT